MTNDPSSMASSKAEFRAASDRRAHDLAQLSEADRAQVQAIRDAGDAVREARGVEQGLGRDADIAAERARMLLQHSAPAFVPLFGASAKRPTIEEIDRRAAQAVDRRNALELKGIEEKVERSVDDLLAAAAGKKQGIESREAENDRAETTLGDDADPDREFGSFYSSDPDPDPDHGRDH